MWSNGELRDILGCGVSPLEHMLNYIRSYKLECEVEDFAKHGFDGSKRKPHKSCS